MYKIGITGGIGAGKSTVSHIFSVLGVPIYNADQRAKALMSGNQMLVAKIKDLLGNRAYDGSLLNRAWIAQKVFADPWLLNKLNGIVHPVVEEDYHYWHQLQVNASYTLKEAALLFDAGSYLTLDATIVITAAEELRARRVIERDQTSEQKVRERMDQQWPEYRRLQLADFVIDNNGDKSLISQVFKIHEELSA